MPAHVVLPSESLIVRPGIDPQWDYHVGCWRYVRGTVERLGDRTELSFSSELGRPVWSAFELLVDDATVVIDYSDFPIVAEVFRRYDHWLRFQHSTTFEPFERIGSFPPWSFLDWNELDRLRAEGTYSARGDKVVCAHTKSEGRLPGLVRRRAKAESLLTRHFPERVDAAFTPQADFFRRCREGLVTLHIPGSQPHSLDRTTHQLFALGVCVVSPDIWTTCCEVRPQANRDYLRVSDDLEDLPDVVDWAIENRDQCAEIGRNARRFFDAHGSPKAIWSYVKRRLSR